MRGSWIFVAVTSAGAAAADDATIRRVLAESTAAFNRHEPNLTPEPYADEYDVVNPVGQRITGKPNLGEAFQTFLKNAKKVETVQRIRYIRPDVALVDAEFEFTGVEMKPAKGLESVVLVKADGRWIITALRTMIPVTMALAVK